MIILYCNLSFNNNRGAEMLENVEIKEIRNACIALSLPNQQRAYEVACALKFAEKTPGTAANVSHTGDSDRDRGMTKRG